VVSSHPKLASTEQTRTGPPPAEEGKERTILFNLSGHGHFDMAAYEKYFAGELVDYEYPAEKVQEALAHLPMTR
jgi:predicted alternative tryptophan synthase beta-subunit